MLEIIIGVGIGWVVGGVLLKSAQKIFEGVADIAVSKQATEDYAEWYPQLPDDLKDDLSKETTFGIFKLVSGGFVLALFGYMIFYLTNL